LLFDSFPFFLFGWLVVSFGLFSSSCWTVPTFVDVCYVCYFIWVSFGSLRDGSGCVLCLIYCCYCGIVFIVIYLVALLLFPFIIPSCMYLLTVL
jgi:hypothetical protein